MKLRLLFAAIIIAVLVTYSLHASEQYGATVLRSVNRSGTFQLSQAAVFSFDVLDAYGGVLSQTDTLFAETDGPGSYSVTIDLDTGEYPGYLTVNHGSMEGRYFIAYADLVPMALFVDSGATALYTLWGEGRLPNEFLTAGGFVAHRVRGHVAVEFDGTRYADALYFIDLCETCLSGREIAAGVSLEKQLGKSAAGRSGSSYINTDVELPYHFDVVNGGVVLSGGVARFRWSTYWPVTISAEPLIRESGFAVERVLLQEVPDMKLLADLQENVLRELTDGATFAEEAAQRKLDDGFFLFETLALLRTARANEPDDWADFMTMLRSDRLVSANPLPWERYTHSYCTVYPDSIECRS
ncbi:MAG: hypothetical protein OXF93_22595 [Acidobacteria bacterium]|nr:hypothetical protein [Acidobacteriota bacterium]